jgi:cytochrome b subunit of formate dehydrogenase
VTGPKLAKNLLLLLAVALVMAGIGLLVSISRVPGGGLRVGATTALDRHGCLTCHGDPQYEPETGSRPWRELHVDEAELASSTHGSIECTRCHFTFDTGQRIEERAVLELCGRCHSRELSLQQVSTHSDPEVATCLDCHSPGGSGHDIPAILNPDSPAFPRNTAETCGGCHADERFIARYELKTDVRTMYLDSPHGKVLQLTGADVAGLYPATCTTCHGSHDVMETDDPESPVSSIASLASVCATCHPGANESFAGTLAIHAEFASEELSPAAFYGERFFLLLTAGVVGIGILIVGLESFAWLTGRANGVHGGGAGSGPAPQDRGQNNPHNPGDNPGDNPGHNPGDHHASTVTASPARDSTASDRRAYAPLVHSAAGLRPEPSRVPAEEIVRFDIHQRLQHFVMMAAVLVLVFTGLPQKFPDWGTSQWLIGVWGGLDSARYIHRFAGLLLITNSLYHLGYVAFSTVVLRKPLPIAMIPTPRDVADFFQDLQYWFGRSSVRPRFGRFSYREKFDYWAIFWGMPVLAASGLVLMFPVLVSKFLPGDAVSVALVAHSDEAILAVLWIFIVHFFFVHLNPRFFPLNRAMFTGKMTRRLYAEEHPLELAALDVAHGPGAGSDGDPDDERAREGK